MVKGVFATVRKKWHTFAILKTILSLALASGSVLAVDAAIALEANQPLKAADITVATLDGPELVEIREFQAAESTFAPMQVVIDYGTPTFAPEFSLTKARKAADIEVATLAPSVVADVLFYGQAPQAGELAHDYLVFEVQGEQLTGVIYQPQSEYACFQGTVGSSGLQLAIASPFDDTIASYGIAFDPDAGQVAGHPQAHMQLAGFHAIADIGTQEQNLLTQCL